MRTTVLIFSGTIFAVNLLFAMYVGKATGGPVDDVAAAGLIHGLILAVLGGGGYLFGLRLAGSDPEMPTIVFNAAFSFFFAYAVCSMFGLMQISWLIFAAMVYGIAFLAGWRLSGTAE